MEKVKDLPPHLNNTSKTRIPDLLNRRRGLLPGIQENVRLADYTTFKIGGRARYFYTAKTSGGIKRALQFAKEQKLPYCIIGNGSNILVSDRGFGGLVIKIQNKKCNVDARGGIISVDAGINLNFLVKKSISAELSGLEWMFGIPGTLGGAIYGNAGAYGHSIGEVVESIKVFNNDNSAEEILTVEKCEFAYRHSIFKRKRHIILSADLKLEKGDKAKSEKIIKENISKRQGRHPIGPSAGSVFKNPPISENQKAFERIARNYSEAERFRFGGKIPAGWLIGEHGLKGKRIGGAMVSVEHGNFILNVGGAKAEDVIMLISLIKQKIRVSFGIQLEEEIQYVGF